MGPWALVQFPKHRQFCKRREVCKFVFLIGGFDYWGRGKHLSGQDLRESSRKFSASPEVVKLSDLEKKSR